VFFLIFRACTPEIKAPTLQRRRVDNRESAVVFEFDAALAELDSEVINLKTAKALGLTVPAIDPCQRRRGHRVSGGRMTGFEPCVVRSNFRTGSNLAVPRRSGIVKGFRMPARGCTAAGVRKASREETAGEFATAVVSIYGDLAPVLDLIVKSDLSVPNRDAG
jgi:hypothetical protein